MSSRKKQILFQKNYELQRATQQVIHHTTEVRQILAEVVGSGPHNRLYRVKPLLMSLLDENIKLLSKVALHAALDPITALNETIGNIGAFHVQFDDFLAELHRQVKNNQIDTVRWNNRIISVLEPYTAMIQHLFELKVAFVVERYRDSHENKQYYFFETLDQILIYYTAFAHQHSGYLKTTLQLILGEILNITQNPSDPSYLSYCTSEIAAYAISDMTDADMMMKLPEELLLTEISNGNLELRTDMQKLFNKRSSKAFEIKLASTIRIRKAIRARINSAREVFSQHKAVTPSTMF